MLRKQILHPSKLSKGSGEFNKAWEATHEDLSGRQAGFAQKTTTCNKNRDAACPYIFSSFNSIQALDSARYSGKLHVTASSRLARGHISHDWSYE